MTKVISRYCENCGIPFKSEKARFCSQSCRSGSDKGGKTYEEKRSDVISRINQNWLNRKPPKRVKADPTHINLTNY